MIENGTITTITLEDFKSFSSEIGYVDDDFLVITKIEKFPDTDAAFRSSFFMMICCVEGRMQLEMN